MGPGGGSIQCTTADQNGRWVGSLNLVPIIGGSGGAGVLQDSGSCTPSNGGAGGGAITIASSTSISATGSLSANALRTGGTYFINCGSGGAIRLVANSLNIAGGLNAACINNIGGQIQFGVVRLEAQDGQRIFTGYSNPPATLAPINPNIFSSNQPQLTIASVGGYLVPSYAGTRFDTVDLLLPNQIPDPVNVALSATNIPVGTQVQVGFVSGSPSGISVPCTLTGTFASSSCTATISNLARSTVTYLLATAAFAPPGLTAKFNPKGENHIATVRLEVRLGATPKYVFLNDKAKPVETAKIAKEFLQFFGI